MSPIKRELLVNYAINWNELAAEIKAANHFICASCDVECRQEPSDRSKPVLCIAHVDHDYSSPAIFVAPLCVDCHLRHDAPFGMAARRRHESVRRLDAGQMTLLLPSGEPGLSRAELVEMGSFWPTSAYLLTLPDGVDYLADKHPVVGGPG